MYKYIYICGVVRARIPSAVRHCRKPSGLQLAYRQRRTHVQEIEGVPDPAYAPAQQRVVLVLIVEILSGETERKCPQQARKSGENLEKFDDEG